MPYHPDWQNQPNFIKQKSWNDKKKHFSWMLIKNNKTFDQIIFSVFNGPSSNTIEHIKKKFGQLFYYF